MKLRIDIEKTSYEVTVEFLDDAHNGHGHRHWQPGEISIPDSVTRPRPPLKLLEDTFCRSPIAGRIAAVLAVNGQALRKNEPVLVIEAMKMEIQICPAVDGVLKSVRVKAGETVSTGQLLFELI
jgi:biotin carboxyl carrier protein